MNVLNKKNYCAPHLTIHGTMDQATRGTHSDSARHTSAPSDRYILGSS